MRNLAYFWTEQGAVLMTDEKMSENLSREQGQKEAFFAKSNYSKVSTSLSPDEAAKEVLLYIAQKGYF